ncbi:MAG: porphobilinogen synthase [Armatimonadota bacterium]|jgi:porphobilinogen synthase
MPPDYQAIRPRRNRRSEALRRLSREVSLTSDNLILPLFVVPGHDREEVIEAMPGVRRYSTNLLPAVAEHLSVPAVLIFGVPDAEQRSSCASAALDPGGLVPEAVRVVGEARPDIAVITDVCLCGWTDHGHCAVLGDEGAIDSELTLDALARSAVAHAQAGADLIAPSAMMDGQVAAIRAGLDDAGLSDTGILSYAAKFASAFYGPFREAAHSAPRFGDRSGYQLPPSNRREAIRDALLDEAEGADWLMVKPALPYLDVLGELRESTRLPIAAYQVSGEFAMIEAAARVGAIDRRRGVLESLLSIRRAGADAIITYYAEEVAQWISR